MAFIELKNVSFSYEKQVPVLSEVSFDVRENESVGIIGANGAGKSTLLKLLVGLAAGYTGQISLAGLPDTQGQTVDLKLEWRSFTGKKSATFKYRTRD